MASRSVTKASGYRFYVKMLRRNWNLARALDVPVTPDVADAVVKLTKAELENWAQGFTTYSIIRSTVDKVLQAYNVPAIQKIYFYAYAEHVYKEVFLKKNPNQDELYTAIREDFIRKLTQNAKLYPFNDINVTEDILTAIDQELSKLSS